MVPPLFISRDPVALPLVEKLRSVLETRQLEALKKYASRL
jgi:hypothetical protein